MSKRLPTPFSTHQTALSAFWFLYLGAFGVLFPFVALYLSSNAGLTATEIGVITAMTPAVALFAPTVWGRIADRSRSPVRVLAAASFGTAVTIATYGWLRGFWQLLFATAILSVFSTGVMPLAVSVTLASLGERAVYSFGKVRAWGTVGFLLLVVVFPPALHAVEAMLGFGPIAEGAVDPSLGWMFPIGSALILVAVVAALAIPESGSATTRSGRGDWVALLRHGPFVRGLFFYFAACLFFQGPMGLFPLYVRSRGGGVMALSRMWIVMLLPEIPLVAFSGAALRRLGARGLLAGGLAAGGARWLVCGLCEDLRVIYAAQLLHGVTVAGLSVGASLYVEATVPPRLRATGQGLAAIAGAGFGAIVSNVAAGWIMDHAGPNVPFVVGGAGCLALTALLPSIVPPPRRPD